MTSTNETTDDSDNTHPAFEAEPDSDSPYSIDVDDIRTNHEVLLESNYGHYLPSFIDAETRIHIRPDPVPNPEEKQEQVAFAVRLLEEVDEIVDAEFLATVGGSVVTLEVEVIAGEYEEPPQFAEVIDWCRKDSLGELLVNEGWGIVSPPTDFRGPTSSMRHGNDKDCYQTKFSFYQFEARQSPNLDTLLHYVEEGVSPTAALDYLMTEDAGWTQTDWAKRRGNSSQSAISENVARARKIIERYELSEDEKEKADALFEKLSAAYEEESPDEWEMTEATRNDGRLVGDFHLERDDGTVCQITQYGEGNYNYWFEPPGDETLDGPTGWVGEEGRVVMTVPLVNCDGENGLYFTKATTSSNCVHSGTPIERDEVAVEIRCEGGSLWISPRSISPLSTIFQLFDFKRVEKSRKIAELAGVDLKREDRYSRSGIWAKQAKNSKECFACSGTVDEGEWCATFIDQKYSKQMLLHFDCTDRFVDALNEVWEHSDELFSEQS